MPVHRKIWLVLLLTGFFGKLAAQKASLLTVIDSALKKAVVQYKYLGTGHLPGNSEVDVPLTYSDYYYIEAMLRYRAMQQNKEPIFKGTTESAG